MDPVIALLVVCFVLPVALLLDDVHSGRLDRAMARWADAHGFRILEMRPYAGSPEFRSGPGAGRQPIYVVRVLDPDDRTAEFIVKTGVYFLGGCVRPLQVDSVDAGVAA